MGLFKKTGKILGSAARLTGQLGAQAVKLSGDALHGTTQIVKALRRVLVDGLYHGQSQRKCSELRCPHQVPMITRRMA